MPARSSARASGGAEYLKLRAAVEKAERAFREGAYGVAIEALKTVDAAKVEAPIVERGRKLLSDVDAKGQEALDLARALADAGSTDEATKALNDVAKEFAGRPVEKEAKKALAALKAAKG
jgi:hypothetical protein